MKRLYIEIAAVAIFLVLILFVAYRKKRKKLDTNYYQKKWRHLQKLCSNKKLWYRAVIDADELLDDALKQQHIHGKTTGERLVAAQRKLTNNDAVWFGHKLKKRIEQENYKRLNKRDTLQALSGFRQALKDLGALKSDGKVEVDK